MVSLLWFLGIMKPFLVSATVLLVVLGTQGVEGSGQVSPNMEAIKELTEKVDLLQSSMTQIQKEILTKLDTTRDELRTETKASLEKLQTEFESRIKRTETNWNKSRFVKDSSGSSLDYTHLESPMATFPVAMEADLESIENKVTSVVTSTCGTMVSEWITSLDDVTKLLQRTSSDLEAEKAKYSAVIDKVSSIESVVNETLINVVEQWNHWRIANSDVSLCKEGWHYYNESCYFFSFTETNWQGGRQECLRLDSDYVKVTSTEEWNFIGSHITSNSWVGLTDHLTEDKFVWITDGTDQEIFRSWWHIGQPDNHSRSEHCIHFWFHVQKNLWNDSDCQLAMRYICEYSPNGPVA